MAHVELAARRPFSAGLIRARPTSSSCQGARDDAQRVFTPISQGRPRGDDALRVEVGMRPGAEKTVEANRWRQVRFRGLGPPPNPSDLTRGRGERRGIALIIPATLRSPVSVFSTIPEENNQSARPGYRLSAEVDIPPMLRNVCPESLQVARRLRRTPRVGTMPTIAMGGCDQGGKERVMWAGKTSRASRPPSSDSHDIAHHRSLPTRFFSGDLRRRLCRQCHAEEAPVVPAQTS